MVDLGSIVDVPVEEISVEMAACAETVEGWGRRVKVSAGDELVAAMSATVVAVAAAVVVVVAVGAAVAGRVEGGAV